MEFSWATDVDIVKNSCFVVKETEDLNDLRLGASVQEKCLTCGNTWKDCSGHFGHYRFLRIPVIHPLMVSEARKDLKQWGFPEKIKLSQNALQLFKHGDWKILTFYDIQLFLEELAGKEEGAGSSKSQHEIAWLRWAMPISPPCIRPTCYTTERGLSYNDITHRLSSIIRMDKALEQSVYMNEHNKTEHRRYAVRLQLSLTLLFFLPSGARESRELSSIADRFKGKEGRMRQTLLGKRLCYSARTVITGDPCLRLDELGVPIQVAEKLTKPVRVAEYNYLYLKNLLQKNQIKSVVRRTMRFDPKYRVIELKIGDVCHVKLQDGMRVLFNRQPTLWKSSVQCLYVRRIEKKSFSINCEITPAFNADFDGDEMNMYVPQNIECVGELECLMQSREHIVCGNQGVVQDTALAGYLLTLEDCLLSRALFFKCLMFILRELDTNSHLKAHFDLSQVSKGPYTGRALLSCLVGKDITIEGVVEKGQIVSVLNKSTMKKKVLRQMVDIYGKKEASNFLFLLSRIGSEFLRRRGFSVGVSSLEPWKKVDETIVVPDRVKQFIKNTQTKDPWLLLRLGNLYKSLKALKTKEIFSEDNPMLVLGSEKSGAKGSLLNLIQIRSSLGQQYYKGSLIRHFRANQRILSSDKKNILSKDEALLQRGFIDSNFLKGLNPREVMLHAMTSRLSLLDTALKTSDTGYASRRLGKSLEDCIVQYDDTLRNNDRVLFFEIAHFDDPEMVAGHAIGVIAAQSIGQRIMQLTLNTFHTAGTACLEVSDGVPRMEALINVWGKKMHQNAILQIDRIEAWKGHQMIREYDTVYIKDLLLQSIKIVRIKNPPPSCSVYGIKMYLDELVCRKGRICSWDIERSIRNSELYPDIVPVSRNTCVTCFLQKPLQGKEAKQYLLNNILPELRKLCIRGKEMKIKASWSMNKLQLKGMSLKKSFTVFSEFWGHISSSNTLEVFNVLGIEAARIVLLRELDKVFSKGVRPVFLLTLCEWMCWHGFLCPVTRTGILASSNNAWKNMAFEQCLKNACKNASTNSTHDFEGTSERIVVNNYVKQGSGSCSLVEVAGEEILTNEVVEVEENQDDEQDIYGAVPPRPFAFQQHFEGVPFSNSLHSLWSG